MTHDEESRAALAAARAGYGRLVAWLAWQWGSIADAEDALSDALLAALETWPRDGVPRNPEAWLLTASKRAMLKAARRRRVRDNPAAQAVLAAGKTGPMAFEIPDERLRLMLVCAHPAIDPSVHTALMLQCVLGLDVKRMAGLFMVSPDALAKRLVRAKAKIKQAGIRFEIADLTDLADRIHAVLEAIYACYAAEAVYEAATDPDLRDEAVLLARIVASVAPDDPEGLGLLALLLLCEARKSAQFDAQGHFVPLDEQDPAHWSRPLVEEGNRLLQRAFALGRIGPFQLEAAIQSAHCSRIGGGPAPWEAIARMYEGLLVLSPTFGARIGHALALARATGRPEDGLSALDRLDRDRLVRHQSWWAARSYLLDHAGRFDEAVEAYLQARALSSNPRVIAHFDRRIAKLRPAH